MKPETLVMLTLIAAILQVVIQFFGVAKAFVEWLAAKEKAKAIFILILLDLVLQGLRFWLYLSMKIQHG